MFHALASFSAGVAIGYALKRAASAARIPAWTDPPLEEEGQIVEECPLCDDGFVWYADGTIALCVTCGGKLYIPHSHD